MKEKFVSIFSSIGALFWGCIGGSCGLACLAGGCCGGTALLGFLSLSSSTLNIFAKLTPAFLILTILSLGYAFYKAYKPKPVLCCSENNKTDSENCCSKDKKPSFFKSKTFLWITALMCAVMWIYPLIFNNKTKSPVSSTCCPATNNSDSIKSFKIIKITTNPECNQ